MHFAFKSEMAGIVFTETKKSVSQPFQFRHPDITSSAHYVFAVIGLALMVEVLGYYFNSPFFWFVFILGYLAFIVAFTVHTYYNGMME